MSLQDRKHIGPDARTHAHTHAHTHTCSNAFVTLMTSRLFKFPELLPYEKMKKKMASRKLKWYVDIESSHSSVGADNSFYKLKRHSTIFLPSTLSVATEELKKKKKVKNVTIMLTSGRHYHE